MILIKILLSVKIGENGKKKLMVFFSLVMVILYVSLLYTYYGNFPKVECSEQNSLKACSVVFLLSDPLTGDDTPVGTGYSRGNGGGFMFSINYTTEK